MSRSPLKSAPLRRKLLCMFRYWMDRVSSLVSAPMRASLPALVAASASLSCATPASETAVHPTVANSGVDEPLSAVAAGPPREEPLQEEPPREGPSAWAERTLASLTLEEKAGQLVMPWILGDFVAKGDEDDERVLGYVRELGIGGVVVSVGSPTEVAAKLNHLQRHAKVPLLVGSDLEAGAGFRMRGAVYMPGAVDLGGATRFPSLMAAGAAGDAELVYEMGRITALEARAVGIHVPFAPVLDVNNNPANPIINVRSFGEDPEQVAKLGAALVRGIQDHGAVATGKHFPGHGDTDADSHLELPVIRHGRERLDAVELRPFREAVAAGMGGVMTAHVAVPALSGGTSGPSTLSPLVMTDLLRNEMGFQGLLFTDAMDMHAISRRHRPAEAAIRALEAGADVILMPPSPDRVVAGVARAVRSGRVSETRLDQSVRRILRAKEAAGLHRGRTVAVEKVRERVGVPAHREVAEEVARRSIVLLKNDRRLLPLRGTRSARVTAIVYRRPTDVLAGRSFHRRLRDVYPRLRTAALDENTPAVVYDSLAAQAPSQHLVVVGVHVAAVSYEGSVATPKRFNEFVGELGAAGVPHVVVSFGNPYLVSEFPDVRAYMLAWSGSHASQVAAAGALFGEFPISGRAPTAIPPLFETGDGISLPAKGATPGG